MKRTFKLIILLALTAALCLPFGVCAAAGAGPDADVPVGIADRGVLFSAPENSMEGLRQAAATGIDGVLIDVSATSDGVLVALEAESAARMLEGAQSPAVAAYPLETLRQFRLREGVGGEQTAATEQTVSTLEEMLAEAKAQGIFLALRFDLSLAERVKECVDAADARTDVLLFPEGKNKKELESCAASLSADYAVLLGRRSNIVFEVTGLIKKMAACGAWGINLKTTNRYGINFYPSVLRRFPDGLHAVADTSDPVTCGARTDCAQWWEDLLSRGYSVIITGDPAAFVRYRASCGEARTALEEALGYATREAPIPVFKKELLNDIKKAYDDAVNEAQSLLSRPGAPAGKMQAAAAALYDAVNEVELHYAELTHGTAGVTVTVPRLILCALAAAAVAAVQIYFYKKRKRAV